MLDIIKQINARPKPFEFYTAEELWTDEHTSKKMLEFHLNDSIDLSSRSSSFIEKSVQWIAAHFNIDTNTHIADFGCGPGLYTTRFAEHGANVTGIDFSSRSIEYAINTAKQKDLNIEYIQQNYLKFEPTKQYDLITLIFCDYCALSPAQRKQLLAIFSKSLKPNGSLLMDVHSLNLFNEKKETATYAKNSLDHFFSANDYYCFLNTFKYNQEKVTLDKYSILENEKIRTIYNWLQFYTPDSLQAELNENGFNVTETYSDVAGKPFSEDSPDFAVIANII